MPTMGLDLALDRMLDKWRGHDVLVTDRGGDGALQAHFVSQPVAVHPDGPRVIFEAGAVTLARSSVSEAHFDGGAHDDTLNSSRALTITQSDGRVVQLALA